MKQVYEFLEVPASDAERAWRAFCESHPNDESDQASFIPASGGSFVVLQVQELPRWLSFLNPYAWEGLKLEDFKDFLLERF